MLNFSFGSRAENRGRSLPVIHLSPLRKLRVCLVDRKRHFEAPKHSVLSQRFLWFEHNSLNSGSGGMCIAGRRANKEPDEQGHAEHVFAKRKFRAFRATTKLELGKKKCLNPYQVQAWRLLRHDFRRKQRLCPDA